MRPEPQSGIFAVGDVTPMTVRHSDDREPVMIVVAGDVDADSAGYLQDSIGTVIEDRRAGGIELDLAGVTFLDSGGIRALLLCHAEAEVRGCPLVMTAASPAVHRVLHISGLLEHFGLPTARR